jgi:hypothetical protein
LGSPDDEGLRLPCDWVFSRSSQWQMIRQLRRRHSSR